MLLNTSVRTISKTVLSRTNGFLRHSYVLQFPNIPFHMRFASRKTNDSIQISQKTPKDTLSLEPKLKPSERTESDALVQQKPRRALVHIFPLIYCYVLIRIKETVLIYLNSSLEDQKSVKEDSRFFYVKKRIDSLSPEQQIQFRDYLNLFDEIRSKKDHSKEGEEVKKHKMEFTKIRVKEFLLTNPTQSKVLVQLIMDFLTVGNRDLQYYIEMRQDETSIGQFSAPKIVHPKTSVFLQEHATYFKLIYKKFLIELGLLECSFPKNKGPDTTFPYLGKIQKQNKTLFIHVFRRVRNTCKLYLASSPEQQEAITPESRFYYVHEKFSLMTQQQREDFWTYLDSFYQLASLSDVPVTRHFSPIDIFFFLRANMYGKILADLISIFLEGENADFLLYTSSDQDEYSIGKLGPSSVKMKKVTRDKLYKGRNSLHFEFKRVALEGGLLRS